MNENRCRRVHILLAMAVLLLIGAAPLFAVAAPDLVVERIDWIPADAFPGGSVTVRATIENVGPTDADDRFYVRFAVDGDQISSEMIRSGIAAGDRVEVSASWTAVQGVHRITVEADAPFDRINESNERNNEHAVEIVVPLARELLTRFEGLRIIVARFEDLSGSGFLNLGQGVADKVSEQLSRSGIRILDRGEFEVAMQDRGLNPRQAADVATAASLLGADLVVLGTIAQVNLRQTSISFGMVRLSGGSADAVLDADIVSTRGGALLGTLSAEGTEEGMTGFSVDLGSIVALSDATNVCTGGFRTEQDGYFPGQAVAMGYRNPGVSDWFGVEIHTLTGTFLRWLGWQYVPTDECRMWYWDQQDSIGLDLPPGVYRAMLRAGGSFIESVTFQIRPGIGISLPLFDEITVGQEPFEESVVGGAVNQAADRLASSIVALLGEMDLEAEAPPAAFLAESAGSEARAAMVPSERRDHEAQIAAILPDGRVAINIGLASGLAVGDVVQVYEIQNLVVDPASFELLDYEILRVKGEAVVVEVRDRVSYVLPLSEFEPAIGDVVASLLP